MRIFAYPVSSLGRPNTPFRYAVLVNGRWVGPFAPGAVRVRRVDSLGVLSLTAPERIAEMERRIKAALAKVGTP